MVVRKSVYILRSNFVLGGRLGTILGTAPPGSGARSQETNFLSVLDVASDLGGFRRELDRLEYPRHL
jgi:hypothetical protein